jgi:alpha-tubulin suppressor-like RCC1 family protein
MNSIVCGPTDTALVSKDGRLYVTGENKSGQLGLGHSNPVLDWTLLSGWQVKSVQLGAIASSFITTDGDLYTFGSSGSALTSGLGCLGQGNGEPCPLPTLVESLVEDGCQVKDAIWGESSLTVLTEEGHVLTTGASSYGRLGNGETSVDQYYLEPTEAGELTDVHQIAGGKSFTFALQDGVLFGWGRNHKGQLGTGFGMAVDMYSMEQVPTPMDSDVLLDKTVVKVAAGANHAACITSDGQVFEWGMALFLEPVRVNHLLHTKIIDIVCGNDYTLCLSEDHQVYAWGRGSKTGVLGLDGASVSGGSGGTAVSSNISSKTHHFQPQLVHSLVDQKVISIHAGWAHAACIVEQPTTTTTV